MPRHSLDHSHVSATTTLPPASSCLTDPLARVNQPTRSQHYGGGHAARTRIQQHDDNNQTMDHPHHPMVVITASNAHEKMDSSPGSLRALVGDFGLTLFNPLACCTAPPDANFVWELQDEEDDLVAATSALAARLSRDVSCADSLTVEGSVASTAVTAPESEEDNITTSITSAVILEEEPLHVLKECPRILTTAMMQQLQVEGLPDSLHMCRWERCYAIGRDGDSFYSLLERCTPFQRTFVVIQTTAGHVLGGYAAMPWKKRDQLSNSYFGTGQSFLFASHPQGMVIKNSDKDQHNDATVPLHLFRWTGSNDFCQICDPEEGRLGMGGGCDFGFLVQDDLQRGRTGPCGTFGNPSLAPDEYFEIQALEIYGLRPFGESVSSASSQSMQAFFG